ncbi:prephenate dehydratase [Oleidesulfovibrio alaskensis G20]|jgi:chorismate mutase/prephenate dehydratase|uniref:Bifunctional chorismate mutase/prephenate dehydratase n=1 Tax=Oleidesulfovibrio alaskensis (strain ATCC BAA-1058 / DSM 17464 / G20) TaxID=207559 RepID=Q30VL6_OLEA2|nr:prephenate dehydratase [Oleidesulfovibrio alaskensis]ABB40280.1 prephenate dehydratase [Oleidesulfovibrio alaskensis G20]MBG0772796.1 prephenate dehydratase [Oleidesulfovibrio alaskensis]MBL3583740.1 prephenate dehydratase [Oleidesulfovibrio alaskensis]
MADADRIQERMGSVREDIDAVDRELLALLNRRAELSLEVGRIKRDDPGVIFKPFRERDVLEKLRSLSAGPLPEEHLRSIYREILSSSRSLQRPQRVAYLGPEGTFSYFAGIQFLGHSVEFLPQKDLHGVIRSVHARECELGVLPLENSLHGTVGQSLDLFLRYEVFINAELFCRISHSLLTAEKRLSDITTVYSHPQPLAQCGEWLRLNLPGARIIPTESTAAAARRIKGEKGAAAIGHGNLAERLGLSVLASAIEDQPDNWTRFVVVGPVPADREGRDKTSMLFTLPDKSGSLAQVLNILAREDINMKKLESRPLRGEKWQYVFFVDVECDLNHEDYRQLVDELKHVCHSLRILGSYPAGMYFDVARTADGSERLVTE